LKRAAWSLLLISLASCANRNHPVRFELVGEWVMMGDALLFPLACGSDGPITYRADGSYSLWGEAGTWRLNGDGLIETLAGFDALHSDRSTDEIGKPMVSTIAWIDENRFTKRFADGSKSEFRRCPKGD